MSISSPDRFAHRGDGRFGGADRLQPFERHRRRHGHRLERGEAVRDRLPGQIGKALGVVDGRFVKILHLAAAEMAIGADVVAHRPAPELAARHASDLAQDVPQGDVDAGDRRGADDAVAVPEVLAIHHLPEVLDAASDLRRRAAAPGLRSRRRPPRVCHSSVASPQPNRPALVGQHLDEDPVPHPGVADERFDRGDFHGPHCSRPRHRCWELPSTRP